MEIVNRQIIATYGCVLKSVSAGLAAALAVLQLQNAACGAIIYI